jgi:phosphatidylserine/phosphatidylglycerophosphate/cardiolipin synthase-like enzyme
MTCLNSGPNPNRIAASSRRGLMEIKFARSESVAEAIIRRLHEASNSIDGALYRFNHPSLAHAMEDVAKRGVRIRLLVDGNKYKESRTTQELLSGDTIPFRLAFGRQGRGSKMHHKFVILDQQTVLTGSYNWTYESEDENQENLLILQDAYSVEAYTREFKALWAGAARNDSNDSR